MATSRNSIFINKVSEEHILQSLFDGNLRAMLNVFRRSKEGREASIKLGVQGALNAIKLTEFMLLGGKMFVDSSSLRDLETRYTDIPAGEVFPNIFWYDQLDGISVQTKWQGLVGLRMLQLANAAQLPGGDLMQILHSIFGYNQTIMIEHLEAFVAFGLLTIDFRGKKSDLHKVKPESPFSSYRSVVRTTLKGQLIATLSISWTDWMYFLALDTPLYRECLPHNSGDKYVRFYRSPKDPSIVEHNYIDAMATTVATFVRHIGSNARAEFTKMKEMRQTGRLSDIESGYVNSGAWEEIFSLPAAWEDILRNQIDAKMVGRMRAVRDGKTDEAQRLQYEKLIQTLISYAYVGLDAP